jgi:hypothetical protein
MSIFPSSLLVPCGLLVALGALTACSNGAGGDTTTTGSGGASSSASTGTGTAIGRDPPGIPGCTGAVLEDDIKDVSTIHGPGVDPNTHEVLPLPSTAVMSTTYLALRTDMATQNKFGAVLGPILPTLANQPGLLAVVFAKSAHCSTERTLSVWKDEMSMFAFVGTKEHTNAIDNVGVISRGGSAVTSWATTNPADATWAAAVPHLADGDGPFY